MSLTRWFLFITPVGLSVALTVALTVALSGIAIAASATESAPQSETYQVEVVEYVVSAGVPVSAKCHAGDRFVRGACEGANWMQGAGERDYPLVFDKNPNINSTQFGFQCLPRVVHPQQVIRVEAVATCARSQPSHD